MISLGIGIVVLYGVCGILAARVDRLSEELANAQGQLAQLQIVATPPDGPRPVPAAEPAGSACAICHGACVLPHLAKRTATRAGRRGKRA
jgi:hypothetical protein